LTALALCHLLAAMIPTKNAKFAILIAEIPRQEKRENLAPGVPADTWSAFLNKAPNSSSPAKGIEVIHNNIWQLNLETGMRTLCEIYILADNLGIPMRVLFLEEAPAWLKYPEHAPKPDYAN
jgi:hypothetical protein